MNKKTKIIATHGPALKGEADLHRLYDAGVNVIRFNFSHAQYDVVREVLKDMRVNNRNGRTALSMLLDTKGPEIRTGDLSTKQTYKSGDIFKFYTNQESFKEDGTALFCDYPHLGEDAYVGQIIDVDSGLFQIEVLEIKDDFLSVQAQNDAIIGSRRHVNLPGIRLKMPGITDKDRADVKFAVEESMDFIAMSFVRSRENVQELREYLKELGGEHIKIISKIENQEGIDNLTEIIAASDGIMVARGDLGIEVPIEKLPSYQSNMVKETLAAGKFTIIATHLLESMIDNPFPTRAEVSDVYNSVMQHTDCVMLSGETAAGKYPIKSVKVMTATIHEAEKNLILENRDFSNEGLTARDIEKKALIKSAISAGEELKVDALFIFTKSGKLARLASSFRPNLPIYAFTMHLQSVAYMNVLFGVQPYLLENWDEQFVENIGTAITICKENGSLKVGDKIMLVNDIQKGETEIPVVELMEIL
ncbi:pyruvate kinase [Candidatus Gracilibacteria bacterium]|nr:pyruvate kinase [Candidatus Gracilibacteria bacterium]